MIDNLDNTNNPKPKKRVLIYTLLVALIAWNIFLTVELGNKNTVVDTGDNSVVHNLTFATTDFTKAAEVGINKTVGIGTQNGSGSGAIYKTEEKGGKNLVTIITNYHVVTTEKTVMVLFANGQKIEGKVIGGDVFTDLAVVQVETDFATEVFTIGDSSTLKSAEWVLAVGSPLGLEFSGTVTEGVVSGKDRIIGVDLNKDGVDDWDMIVIQTSAAINPGNSGGPLINLKGELIGINSMKIASSNVEGMGFSIPINEAIPIVEQLIEKGEVVRPLIGFSGRNISDYTSAQKSYLNLPLNVESGVVVTEVVKNGAADKAKILAGDIIVRIGDFEVKTFKDFRRELYQYNSGDEVEVEVIRNSKKETILVVLG